MNTGFALRELRVTGPGKKDAVVRFADGLNVISGPSDTGKTYILQCVDWTLGAGKPPKQVQAAIGYTAVQLTIERRSDGAQLTSSRSLTGGDIELSGSGEETGPLKAKHKDGDTTTASGYLLDLSGLTGRRVRIDKAGATRGLSFRDIAALTLIDEDDISAERSPVHSRRNNTKTVEERVFRFMITGEDDSSIAGPVVPRHQRQRQDGQADLLDQLLVDLRAERGTIAVIQDLDAGERRLIDLAARVTSVSDALTTQQQTSASMEERRRPAWQALRETESRLQVLQELQTRFELLEQQYRSDLRRLEATAEAGGRLEELEAGRCPVCGALAEHHDRTHAGNHAEPGDVVVASRAEATKIHMLLRDLLATLEANRSDIGELSAKRETRADALSRIDREIDEQLRPRLAALTRTLREAERDRHAHARALDLSRREQQLQQLLKTARGPVRRPKPEEAFATAGVTSAEAERFAQQVEELLRAWHFPELDRVTFSDDAQDIVVSGQARTARGQGVRALTHAAFTLALLRLSADDHRPHPGLAVIDSPLAVYTEPDASQQGFSPAVKDAFYRAIAADFSDVQVIVLENEVPPDDLATRATLTHFTKAAHGRYGFIPVS
ncbi:MAG: hypothetical protein JWR63_4413 [Conexibacter sp.]|nr:hypothetical protein [Conexibacter sp.]